MTDRTELREAADANGWSWAETPDVTQLSRNKSVWLYFVHGDRDTLSAADATDWEQATYGRPALARALRELKRKERS